MPALSHLHMDPEQPVPGVGDGAACSTSCPPEAVDAFVERRRRRLAARRCSRSSSATWAASSGAPSPTTGPRRSIDAGYAMYAVGIAAGPRAAEPQWAPSVETVKAAVGPWAAHHDVPELRRHEP